MEMPPEDPAAEIQRLQRCISDLISALALPAIWSGADGSQIASTLIDALLAMLTLDLVYVRLVRPLLNTPLEIVRLSTSLKLVRRADEIGKLFRQWFKQDPRTWPKAIPNPFGAGSLSIVALKLGLHGDLGLVVVGSKNSDFPRQTDRLLLSVAVNQAAIGLHEAQLKERQRRLTSDLDELVAKRTEELETANRLLKNEIAERRLAERKLRKEERELKESEARKAAILDSALDCIITIDRDGRITEFNPAAERTFGFRRKDVLGLLLTDTIIPLEFQQSHMQGLARLLKTGRATVLGRRLEMSAKRADGTEFPVELTVTRIPLDGPASFTGYLRDITERKKAEEDLRRSEAFLAEAQRVSMTGSFALRTENEQFTWSEQLYRIFEFDNDSKITFDRILSRVHPDDVASVRQIAAEARLRPIDFEVEHRLLMPNKSVKYIHKVAHGYLNQDGHLEYVGAIQDVTERRRSEAELNKVRSELTQAVRATSLGVISASIAHEVNQPLAGIVTNTNTCLRMLANDPPNIKGARETAQRTIRDANRASEVIARLHALFTNRRMATEFVDLNEATREVLSLSSSELEKNGVTARLDLSNDIPRVAGDRVQLQQVILNLIRNASDSMREISGRARELTLRTEREERDRVRLDVKDSGLGLDPKILNRLFEQFFSTKIDGMGIGLSVSRSIVEAHHGRLWAEPNVGPGATFSFSIPYAPTNQDKTDEG